MIINFSRSKTFRACKRRAFNWHHRKLEGQRSVNLVDGAAFHQGVAVGRATKNWGRALKEADELFDEDVKKTSIMPEMLYEIEEHRQLVHAMLKCFQDQYEHETYQIIQPECKFDVELPNSYHHCVFIHWWDMDEGEKWGTPPPERIMAHKVIPFHVDEVDKTCKCWQPHRLVGKTDAIVSWNSNIWLDEYKTTSISGTQFWDQWFMDVQPTVYIYGIWKSLGIRPSGFLLNAINKPSEAQVASYNSKRKIGPPKTAIDYVKYSREAFLRTEQDLLRVEKLMLQTAREWEAEMISGLEVDREPFSYNPDSHTCMSYNRKCDYWSCCLNHEEPNELEALSSRQPDYVDEKLVQILESK